jgi:hypothetical protein
VGRYRENDRKKFVSVSKVSAQILYLQVFLEFDLSVVVGVDLGQDGVKFGSGNVLAMLLKSPNRLKTSNLSTRKSYWRGRLSTFDLLVLAQWHSA